MANEKPLYTLYKGLKSSNYDVPDSYDRFERAFTSGGNRGVKQAAENRHALYKSLKEQNYDVPDTYEHFYTTLFEPVNSTTSRAKTGSMSKPKPKPNPGGMSAADRAAFVSGAQDIIGQSKAGLRRTKNQIEYTKGNAGLKVKPVHLGQNPKVVKRNADGALAEQRPVLDMAPQDQPGQTYVTESGNEYDNRADADIEQNAIDQYNYDNSLDGQLNSAYAERDRLDEALKKRRAELEDKPWWRKTLEDLGKASHSGLDPNATANDPEHQGYENDEEYMQLMSAARKNHQTIQTLEDKKNGKMDNFWHAFGTRATNGYTFADGLPELRDATALEYAKKHIKVINEKKRKGLPLTRQEQAAEAVLRANETDDAVQSMYGNDYGAWSRAGGMMVNSVDFMKDFLLMPGGASMAKGIASKVAGIGGKSLAKTAGESALKAMPKAIARATLKATGVLLGAHTAGAAISNTTGLGRTAALMAQKATGNVTRDENGNYKVENEQGLMHALASAEREQARENGSEMFGEFLPGGKLLGGLAKKGLEKIGLSKVSNFLTQMGNKEWYKRYSQFLKTGGYNGIPGETFEEYEGELFDALTGHAGDAWKDFTDAKQNTDIWLGCATMGALMGAIPMGIHVGGYYKFRHDMNKADKIASFRISKDKWEPLKEELDNTDNGNMADVVTKLIVLNDDLNQQEKKAALDYVRGLTNFRGFNIAQTSNAGDEESQASQEQNDAYSSGYNTTDAASMNEAKNTVALAQQKLDAIFGEHTDAQQILDAKNEDGTSYFTANDRKVAQEAVNAQQQYEGMLQRVRDDIDDEVQQTGAIYDSRTNKDGIIQQAMLKEQTPDGKDKRVYVTSGNVVMADDGKGIDTEKSDSSVVVIDEDGKVQMISPEDIFSLYSPLDGAQAKQQAIDAIKQSKAQEAADKIDGKVSLTPGSTYNVTVNGQSAQATVIADPKTGAVQNADGMVNVSVNGQATTMATGQLQQMVDQANMQRIASSFNQEGNDESMLLGRLVSKQDPQQSDEVFVVDENGDPVHGVVTQVDPVTGEYMVNTDKAVSGKTVQPFQAGELYEMVPDDGTRRDAGVDNSDSGDRSYNNDSIGRDNIAGENIRMNDGIVAKNVPNGSEGTQQPTETQQPAERAIDRIPKEQVKDKQGNVQTRHLWEQADPGDTWDALNEQYQDEQRTQHKVGIRVNKIDKQIKDVDKQIKKLDDSDDFDADFDDTNGYSSLMEKKMQLEAQKGYWQSVLAVPQQRKLDDDKSADEEKAAKNAAQKQAMTEAMERARQEREAVNGVPDVVIDIPADARKRGFRNVNGMVVERQQATDGVTGRKSNVKFSTADTAKGHIRIINADQLQPSHVGGQRNPSFFIDEAQPKDRSDAVSSTAAEKIASGLNPEEITGDGSAYQFSAPTVNSRGEVIQGNNRSDALKLMWSSPAYEKAQTAYKQYIADHAEEFGFTPEDVEKIQQMQHPVMVNELDVNDDDAIRLGQMKASDNESGGVERIDPVTTSQKLGGKVSNFASVLLSSPDEDASLSDVLMQNGAGAVKWLRSQGVISDTAAQSAFDKKGNLTPEARMDLQNILKQSLFQGGVSDLPTMFDRMPAKAQKAILSTFMRDFDSAESERILPEIQKAIEAWYGCAMSNEAFAKASNYKGAKTAMHDWALQTNLLDGNMPSDKFSNFAMELACRLQGCTMREVQQNLNDFFDLVQGKSQGDLFGGTTMGEQTDRHEAIKRIFNIEYKPIKNENNGKNGSDALADDNSQSGEWRHGSQGDGAGRERAAGAGQHADAAGGAEGTDEGTLQTGVRLNKEEAERLLSNMESQAEASEEVELTPEAWSKTFDENNSTDTPIGRVKMGEGQITKFFAKGREKEFGMVGPTLNNPDVIIEEESEAKNGKAERKSSYVFVKTFNRNGEKIKFYASITVKQDGMEVSVSSHYMNRNAVLSKMQDGNVFYIRKALLPNSSDWHLAEHQDGVPDLLPTQGSTASSAAKVGNSSEISDKKSEKVGNVEENSDDRIDEDVVKNVVSEFKRKIDRGNKLSEKEHLTAAEKEEFDEIEETAKQVTEVGEHNTPTEQAAALEILIRYSSLSDDQKAEAKERLADLRKKYGHSIGATDTPGKVAAERQNVNTEPTEGQKEAGNYKKGHIKVDGYDITIENPKGSTRSGKDVSGKAWSVPMHYDYGYIKGTEGVDGDHIDVYLSDEPTKGNVYVVDQIDQKTGKFDEHKVMYGFPSMESAVEAYKGQYEDGWKVGTVTEVSREDFKKWVESSKRKTKPFAEYKSMETAAKQQRTEPSIRTGTNGVNGSHGLNGDKGKEKHGKTKQKAETKEQEPKAEPKKNAGQFGLVSDERMEELKKRLRAKLNNLNMGVDPEVLAIGLELTAGYIDRGVKKFADYSKAMINDLGDVVRPYLKAFYNGVRDMPEITGNGLDKEMDDYDTVSKFNVATIGKDDDDVHPSILDTAEQVSNESHVAKEAQKVSDDDVKKEREKGKMEMHEVDTDRLFKDLKAGKSAKLSDYYKNEGVDAAQQPTEQLKDSQGNPILPDGTLIRHTISSISQITDEDFTHPTRSFQLPILPHNVDKAIGANGKPVIIKKNIFEKNSKAHQFAPEESRRILKEALYNTDLVGQTQPKKRPTHWVAIRVDDESPITVLEVNENKDNVEVVGWYRLDDRNLGRIQRQAEREGGELLILTPRGAAASLSTLPRNLSSAGKDNIKSDTKQEKDKKKVVSSQQKQQEPSLFDELFDDNSTNQKQAEDGLQRNDELRPEGLPSDSDHPGEHSERQGQGTSQGREGSDRERKGTGVRGVLGSNEQPVRSGERLNQHNNHAERGKDYAPTGVDDRIEANIAAIDLMHKITDEGRQATPSEMKVLRRFSGWGGLGKAFKEPEWGSRNPYYNRLKALLSDEEWQEAEMSRNSAYFTPATVIDNLWDIARALGFKGGNVLEGSAGIGNIIGLMPTDMSERSHIHAVEIDSTTGGILRLLYPDAKTDIQGFEQTKVRNGSVDLAITNVPFVTGLHVNDTTGDKDLSRKFGDIHDFCIAKNVRKLKPGGIGIFITSSGTMDKSQKLRDWLVNDGDADVIGAFRMNNETFGGTSATSDIIVVRKRVDGKKSPMAIDVSKVGVERMGSYHDRLDGDKELPVDYNQYFIDHPENMGGKMYLAGEKGDTYRPSSKSLYPVSNISQKKRMEAWGKALGEMYASAQRQAAAADTDAALKGGAQNHTGDAQESTTGVYDTLGDDVKEGSMLVDKQGRLCVATYGEAVPLAVNSNKVKGHTKVECFNAYKRIKDAVKKVLDYQTQHDDNKDLQPLLAELNDAYDTFVNTYGHLNKNTAISFLKNDMDYSGTAALEGFEEYNDKNGKRLVKYSKSDIFSQRVVEKESEPHPTTVKDGVITSIYKNGRIDLGYIAGELGKSREEVKQSILDEGLGFEDPVSGDTVVSYEYLSGNVREKLHQAEAQNEGGRYDANIKALQKVIPMNIPSHLIEYSLGSSWLDPELYEQYIEEKTGIKVKARNIDGTWAVSAPSYGLSNEKNRLLGVHSDIVRKTVFGHELIIAAMKNTSIVVQKTEKHYDGHTETITDKEATRLCGEKIDEIRQDFKDWARGRMQQDPDLSKKYEDRYNDQFNNYVPKEIPDSFVPQYFSGATHKITLRPHQAKAAIRGTTQNVLLAHEVGSGKTFTLISTAMEMRRLGTARKPMVVVQNATVGQFVSSAKFLYPNAKILTIESKDRNAEGRKAFYAKIKYNDWDMVVIPQSVLDMIPDSEERQLAFVQAKIAEKEQVLRQMAEADVDDPIMMRRAQKELETLQGELNSLSEQVVEKKKDSKKAAVARQNAKVRAEEMLDRKVDDVENFDDMGIDALLVDEAHEYKHLGFATAMQRGVKGVDPSYSKKCQGVYLKCQSVMEKTGGKNIIFATGTPISNTAAEIWTFMKYLMPEDMMKDYGIYYFDDFVRNFGDISQRPEFNTAGKFVQNNRFKGYQNLPELVRIWSGVSDTVLSSEIADLQAKIPQMQGGKAQDIYLPQTRALRSIMKYVREQLKDYENMSGKEKKKHSALPLMMYGIAKAAAVDPRLVQTDAEDDEHSKTNACVKETLKALDESKKYQGTVAIFADNYQNKHSGFNLFDDIKEKLVKAGVPEKQIVVIKPGMTVEKKTAIFDKVNAGEVRVVLGTTATLGTGVNMQERLYTLIHLDAPNRPMDYTQRNGRILRQGNLHKEWNIPVKVIRFGVEDSLDVTAYQRLKTKGAIADSIMHGKDLMSNSMENRTIEEEEDQFGDTVAQLSGSEYALLKQQAERELRKYEGKKKQWEADQVYIHSQKPRLEGQIEAAKNRSRESANALDALSKSKEKGIVVGKKRFAGVDAMGDFIKDFNKKVKASEDEIRSHKSESADHVLDVTVDGHTFKVRLHLYKDMGESRGNLFEVVKRKMTYSCAELSLRDIPVKGSLLRNALEDIEQNVVTGNDFRDRKERAEAEADRLTKELAMIKSREGKQFEYGEQLEAAKQKVDEYTKKMKAELDEKEKKYAEMDKEVGEAKGVDSSAEEDEDVLYRESEDELYRDSEEDNMRSVESDNDDKLRVTTLPLNMLIPVSSYNGEATTLQAANAIQDLGPTVFTLDGYELSVSRKTKKKLSNQLSQNANKGYYKIALEHLPEIIGNSVLVEEHRDRLKVDGVRTSESPSDPNIDRTQRFYGAVNINGKSYRVKTTAVVLKQGNNRMHSYEVTKMELLISTPTENSQEAASSSNSITLAKLLQNVEFSYEKGRKILDEVPNNADVSDNDLFYRVEDDPEELDRLDKEPKVKVYRAMQLIDGKLYPPMAAKVNGSLVEPAEPGQWLRADEHPELAKNGLFTLNKGGKDASGKRLGSVPAAYNPYWHTSRSPLNDQFSSAYKRPNLVTVEVEIPKSELTSGYHADGAKDPVGEMSWHAGPVSSKLPKEKERKVILSRWCKVVRVVPDAEVADKVAGMLKGENISVPDNTVTPSLRMELEKRGVPITHTKMVEDWERKYPATQSGLSREGDGAYTDDELSMINDPFVKMLGEKARTAKQRKAFAARERRSMAAAVKELAEKLHLDNVEIRGAAAQQQLTERATEQERRKARAKGYYDRKSGKIVINIDNHRDVEDAVQTLLHEAVAHYGLRQLFGSHFDTFLDNVYKAADMDVRQRITDLALRKYKGDFHVATEEYLASLAEHTNFEHMPDGFWSKIKTLFLKMLHSIGFDGFAGMGVTLSDNELRYILWRSYENLKEPGRYRSILGEAEDVAKQAELKVGNYGVTSVEQQRTEREKVAESSWKEDTRALIRRLVNLSNVFKDKVYRLVLDNVSERQERDLRSQGINVDSSWHHSIENSSIIHAQTRHGATMSDFERIPYILDNYDDLHVSDNKNGVGNQVIIYKKTFTDGTTYYLEEVRNGRHSLAFQTMYKKGGEDPDGLLAKPTPKRSKTTSDNSTSSAAKLGNNAESVVNKGENVSEPEAWGKNDLLSKAEQVSHGMDPGLLFRDTIEDDDYTARETYNHMADEKKNVVREAWQDSMINVRNLQEAVLKQRGEKMEDWEDAYNEENLSHGKSLADSEYFTDNLYKPLLKAVNAVAKAAKVSVGDVTEYMMAKHGLERNIVFASRDAQKAYDKAMEKAKGEYDALMNAAQAESDPKKKDALEKRAQKVKLPDYNDLYLHFRQRDYSGLTSLTGQSDAQDAEAEAGRIVTDMESRVAAVNGSAQNGQSAGLIDDLWQATNAATEWTLRKAYESGMMSRDNYDQVRSMFSNYIPLRGWEEDTAGDLYDYVGSGDKGTAFSPTLLKAKGRRSQADNPIAYIGSMAVSAIVQGNKNKVKQTFMRFAENHPTNLVTVSEMWYRNFGTDTAPDWREDVPYIPEDATADEIAAIVKQHEDDMEQLEAQGMATKQRGRLHLGVPVKKGQALEHHVEVMVNGKKYVLYINGNPRAAQALNGTRMRRASERSFESSKIAAIGRKLAERYTSLSPSFTVSNMFRDLSMAAISTAIKESPAYALRFRLNVARLGGPARMFGLMRWYRKAVAEQLPTGQMSGIKRYFYEFMTQGAETGFTSLKEIDTYKDNMQKMYEHMNQSIANPKRLLRGLSEGLEYTNRCIEDMTRFATYMTSRESGRSVRESVSDAKNITLNFNRKGSGELGNSTYRNLQIFVNPAIQSLQNVASMAMDHPVKFSLYTGMVALIGAAQVFATQLLWSMFGGGDGDDDNWNAVDEYWKLPTWQRRNNLVMWIPGTKKFAMIPLAQEFRVFHGFGETLTTTLQGKSDENPALELMSQTADLLPLDFAGNNGNMLVNLAPTVTQPLLQVGFNTDFTGRPLYKDNSFNKYEPSFQKAYVGTPSWLVKSSEILNDLTGGDAHKQGWWERTKVGQYANNPAVVDHLLKGYYGGMYSFLAQTGGAMLTAASGKIPDVQEVPVANRVVTAVRETEQSGKQKLPDWYYEMSDDSKRYQSEVSGYRRDMLANEPGAKQHFDAMTKTQEFKMQAQIQAIMNNVNQIRAAQPTVEKPQTKEDAQTKQELAEGLQTCLGLLDKIRKNGKPLSEEEMEK